jgi:hypothetical protein
MESKKNFTIPNNLWDSIFKLSDADIIAGDLTTVLSDMLVHFESDSVLAQCQQVCFSNQDRTQGDRNASEEHTGKTKIARNERIFECTRS